MYVPSQSRKSLRGYALLGIVDADGCLSCTVRARRERWGTWEFRKDRDKEVGGFGVVVGSDVLGGEAWLDGSVLS